MSKRQIESALRAKGLACDTLEYNHQVTPGEVVGGWEIELSESTAIAVFIHDPDFDDWEPDCRNTAEVLEWIEALPNLHPVKSPKKKRDAAERENA